GDLHRAEPGGLRRGGVHRVGGQRRRAARRGQDGAGHVPPGRQPAQRDAPRRDAQGLSTAMRDQEALLQAIREAPEEDAPRLVYADWLEDHGDPDRAEFIRLQVERGHEPGEPHWRYLPPREQELLRKHQKAWLGPLARWKNDLEFRRGFLEHLSL